VLNKLIIKLAYPAILLLAISTAQAQSIQPVGQDRDWAAFSATVDGGKTCFVVSQPKDMEPKNVARDPVYFYVTQRPSDNIASQVSIVTGYPYQEDSKTIVQIGSDTFTLFTRGDKAWIENLEEQARLVDAMKRGATMIVRGTSSRGTQTTDTYSLSGVTAALARLNSACS
jgi:invasion associated locus B (IalB) protein